MLAHQQLAAESSGASSVFCSGTISIGTVSSAIVSCTSGAMYLNLLLAERDALDDLMTRPLVGARVLLELLFEDLLVFGAARSLVSIMPHSRDARGCPRVLPKVADQQTRTSSAAFSAVPTACRQSPEVDCGRCYPANGRATRGSACQD